MRDLLSDNELKSLTKVLVQLERSTLMSTGLKGISGGFAHADMTSYDDDIIDITLKFGCQSDTDSYVEEEDYQMDRSTFIIIN